MKMINHRFILILLIILISTVSFPDDDLAIAYYQSGTALFKQGKYQESIAKLSKSLSCNPDLSEAIFKMGECFEKLKDNHNAIDRYRRCYKLLGSKPELGPNEKTVFIESGRKLDKLDVNGKLFNSIKKNYSDRMAKLAEDYADKNMTKLSRKIIDELLVISPDDKRAVSLKEKTNKPPDSGGKMVLVSTNKQGLKEYKHTTGMEFVLLPKGNVKIGESDISVDGFYCAKYEVTQKIYREVMGTNPSRFTGDDNPVERVSWNDASEFCQKSGLRLLTESEWEYACRAGTTSKLYWGSGNNNDYMWSYTNADKTTHPVGAKKPNNFGLYDMSGNVFEWCNDWFDKNYYKAGLMKNPSGPAKGIAKLFRGGSWFMMPNGTEAYQSSFRNFLKPDEKHDTLGFRCAMDK